MILNLNSLSINFLEFQLNFWNKNNHLILIVLMVSLHLIDIGGIGIGICDIGIMVIGISDIDIGSIGAGVIDIFGVWILGISKLTNTPVLYHKTTY